MSGVLLKNCFYIQPSADEEGLRGADILIEGESISRIGRASPLPAGRA